MSKVTAFTLHNDRGLSILNGELLNWRLSYPEDKSGIFGPVVRYSWIVEGRTYERVDKGNGISLVELPDATGFICFERDWKPDNCLLLDVYGKERMRLSVPWQLTRPQNPESARPPTSFANVSEPYVNPASGEQGEFGVTAWVEHAGQYYFELDYHTGQFLWGKEIRD